MFIRILPLVALVTVGSLVGCSAASDDESDDGSAVSDDELRTGGVTEFTLSQGTGFRPPPPPGGCNDAGRYTVKLGRKTFEANACIEGRSVAVNRALTADEHKDVKAALSKVRTTKRPTACPTDFPVTSLTVKRGSSETHYVQAMAACGGGSTAVTDQSLRGLRDLLQSFATPAASPETFEGTLQSVMAIGGETTGRVLITDAGTYELVLEGSDANAFVDGRTARVVGTRVDKQGVEIAVRHLIEVDDLLVCPSSGRTVNCMPPTTSKLCKNTQWIEANCSGVSFVH